MDGSGPPMHDNYSMIGPTQISHSDGSYNDNNNANNTSYGTTMTFQNNNPIPALNQMISVLGGGGPPQSNHGHLLSPSHTISPTIYSPATPTYIQSPSTSTPHKSNYALNSPSVAEYPSLFGPGPAQLHSGWNQQASPRNHVPDLNYNLSMGNYQQNPTVVNSAAAASNSSHHLAAPPINSLGPNVHPLHPLPTHASAAHDSTATAAEPGSPIWLSNHTTTLSSQQRIEVETAYETWRSDIQRQILVVEMYCDWFEHQRRPKKDALLKFYRAKLAPVEDTSRVRGGGGGTSGAGGGGNGGGGGGGGNGGGGHGGGGGGRTGGQGARGGAVGYTCEWPGCSKSFGGRTDRVHEHALTHLNIKMFVCDADKCRASFLRKNELNRHLKSCKLRLPDANSTGGPTNALFLSMPSSPVASTSRPPANERPRRQQQHQRQRSARGVSADISPSTSGNDSPNVSTMNSHSFPGFLSQTIIPQGHFQSQHPQLHQLQMPGPGPGFGDGQMYHGLPTPQHQQQQHNNNTLHHGHGHGHAHQNQQRSHMMGVNTGGSDMTPMPAYAEQVSTTPPRYHGRAFPDPTQ